MKKLLGLPVLVFGYLGFCLATLFVFIGSFFYWLGCPATAHAFDSVFDWYLIRFLRTMKWCME
jgi:hypothetical protein